MAGMDPVIARLAAAEPTSWLRAQSPAPGWAADAALDARVTQARARFSRFAGWFARTFPDSAPTGGVLESPLVCAPALQAALEDDLGAQLRGRLWVKRDDLLPVSGSVKSRGGIHEVLEYAEEVLEAAGLDASDAGTPAGRRALAGNTIAVGSTGNLGLSIGLVGAALGLRAVVHMSRDAKAWKKELLRERGAEVVEHAGDFSAAVAAGREQAADQADTHFVDDEASLSLFAGYAVAAGRLAGQLRALEIPVDHDHPLGVHLPCGVGGAPGGIAYGLYRTFGADVFCVLHEPVAAPAVFLGERSGLRKKISIAEIGLDGRTDADGLAVGRMSSLVGGVVGSRIDGFATHSDAELTGLVARVHDAQGWRLEPSATAGLTGPWRVQADADFLRARGLDGERLDRATHIAWSTGGSMVPEEEFAALLAAGRGAALR
ncbi:D-serine dehydratase [Corynebacterium frankenforstense DSM 45800]|uniref:Probable D-serine dehydratase n=2 Tax=Corynebacterium TaxID=1716 RepID=A0A1L7CU73_9CORY|nr:D-serine dehydratase [Corynebacterium frankenforstense DSM 45800]